MAKSETPEGSLNIAGAASLKLEIAPVIEIVCVARAKFTFEGQEGEMSFRKGDVVEILEKDKNGWWLVKRKGDGVEGWAPGNYLEEVVEQTFPVPQSSMQRQLILQGQSTF